MTTTTGAASNVEFCNFLALEGLPRVGFEHSANSAAHESREKRCQVN